MKTLFIGLAVAALLSLALASPALPQEGAEAYMVPDLRPLRPVQLQLTKDEQGRKILRFTVDILNKGTGPLELHPREEDCDEDGNPDNDRAAYQKLFEDTNLSGEFERGEDGSEERFAGCQHFHPLHDHWHFDDFGTYKLFKFSDGKLLRKPVARSDKVSFCMVDTFSELDLPGSPEGAYYRSADSTDCGQDTVTGISIGWVDRYGFNLPGQSLLTQGLRNGSYCLRVRSDPTHLLEESNAFNNARGMKIRLVKSDQGTKLVIPNKEGCA